MKIALYIEDGLEQIVLTPESDAEKGILGKLDDGSRELSIKRGHFFECMGGYVRHDNSTQSVMIVLRPPRPAVIAADNLGGGEPDPLFTARDLLPPGNAQYDLAANLPAHCDRPEKVEAT